jgi:hypothetical protein
MSRKMKGEGDTFYVLKDYDKCSSFLLRIRIEPYPSPSTKQNLICVLKENKIIKEIKDKAK